ncbi:hypothetical protein PoB_003307700 [Plakobranchus ocellatus]|uniref:Uncharacterized protein n=1 Tax=Plakobranchus ocellatus TaxID=259542 RepID=A0AAV4AHR8_9GAST|nr:hypothetical protein PoB_003307700 [Plakobranchus ocellatus]
MTDKAGCSSNTGNRFGHLCKVGQAQILLEELPSDLSQEEPDLDPDDPTYEPETLEQRDLCWMLKTVRIKPTKVTVTNRLKSSRFRRWKKQEKDDYCGEFQHPEGPKESEFENCGRPIDFFS